MSLTIKAKEVIKTRNIKAAFAPDKQDTEKDANTFNFSPEDEKKLVKAVVNPPEPTPTYTQIAESFNQVIKKAC